MEIAASVKEVARKCYGSGLRARREALGMTQMELATMTGISVKLISAYENDRVRPRKQNRELLLEALEGPLPKESGAPPTPTVKPEVDAEVPTYAEIRTEVAKPCDRCGEMIRLLGSRELKVLVAWTDENGDLAAIAAAHDDNRLLTIRASVVPSTLDDLRSLRVLVDRLDEQFRRSAP